ncbi:MAG: LemA family protein [Clostridia bacterium]|nr:LemA family protein [Clostridia bacterium]
MANIIALAWWGTLLIVLGVVLFIIIIVSLFAKTYNNLVNGREKVKNGWSQIDVQLRRRFDLIPNLVETVKGYAAHEKETLENVTMWRSRVSSAATPEESMEANKGLSGALGRLLVTMEKYPDLKANQNFLKLQNELTEIENKISFARQFYNDTVQKYNVLVKRFPSNIIASMFKFKEEKFFEVDNSVRENVPQVKF